MSVLMSLIAICLSMFVVYCIPEATKKEKMEKLLNFIRNSKCNCNHKDK